MDRGIRPTAQGGVLGIFGILGRFDPRTDEVRKDENAYGALNYDLARKNRRSLRTPRSAVS